MPTCVGHTARSALAEPRESLNKSPSASGESFTPAFAYQNLEIHPVFLRFWTQNLKKNLSPFALVDLIRASLVRVFADQLILAYCLYYKPSETKMCDENVNFSTLTKRVLK